MPIATSVLRDGRVLLNTYTDPLDLSEAAHNIIHMHREYLDAATQPIHIIGDFTKITKFPSHILSGTRKLMRAVHPMSGQTLLVTPSMFMNMMAESVRNLNPKNRISVFYTFDEAMRYVDGLLEKETEKAADLPTDTPSVPS